MLAWKAWVVQLFSINGLDIDWVLPLTLISDGFQAGKVFTLIRNVVKAMWDGEMTLLFWLSWHYKKKLPEYLNVLFSLSSSLIHLRWIYPFASDTNTPAYAKHVMRSPDADVNKFIVRYNSTSFECCEWVLAKHSKYRFVSILARFTLATAYCVNWIYIYNGFFCCCDIHSTEKKSARSVRQKESESTRVNAIDEEIKKITIWFIESAARKTQRTVNNLFNSIFTVHFIVHTDFEFFPFDERQTNRLIQQLYTINKRNCKKDLKKTKKKNIGGKIVLHGERLQSVVISVIQDNEILISRNEQK